LKDNETSRQEISLHKEELLLTDIDEQKDKVVVSSGKTENADGNPQLTLENVVDKDTFTYCLACSCCPSLCRSRASTPSEAMLNRQQTYASGSLSWRLENLSTTAHTTIRDWTQIHTEKKGKRKELKHGPVTGIDQLSEIDALWSDNPHWVQPEDLCQISSLGVLGEGRGIEGGVTGVLHIPTCDVYALKSTNRHSEIENYIILKRLTGGKQMPQLMELNGLFVDGSTNNVALVVEYMNLGSLHDHFTSCENPCSEEQMRYIARETLLGLRTLHGFETPVLHCDIKPNNILLASGGSVRIGDYGLLQVLQNRWAKCMEHSGTGKYFSPERHQGSYAMPADIWALGVTLVECLIGRLIEPEELTNVRLSSGTSPLDFVDLDKLDKQTVTFLQHCLDPDPEKRWSAERLLSDPLFTHDFSSPTMLFPSPAMNEALLKEILSIIQAFIRQRVEILGRASRLGRLEEDDVWSHSNAISHEERLDNIVIVTGYKKVDVQKFVHEMYLKQASTTSY
jgi:hypothetical protein